MLQQDPSYSATSFEHGDQLDFSQTPEHMVSPAEYNRRKIEEATQRALAFASSGSAASRYDAQPVGLAEAAVEGFETQSIQYIARVSVILHQARQEKLAA